MKVVDGYPLETIKMIDQKMVESNKNVIEKE
jgi:hypothetical protein